MNRINRNKAFTLVEIMIVVMIIGILMAIAVPNFIHARDTSQTNSCIANLQQIDAAQEQWAMETHQLGTANVVQSDLDGTGGTAAYIQTWPACPAGGTYTLTTVDAFPTCNITGHVLAGTSAP